MHVRAHAASPAASPPPNFGLPKSAMSVQGRQGQRTEQTELQVPLSSAEAVAVGAVLLGHWDRDLVTKMRLEMADIGHC